MTEIKVVKGTPPPQPEVEFAKGQTVGTQRIRVTYTNLNEMEPDARFPTIYKTHGDDSVTSISFTPEEGRFLAQVLTAVFAG